MHIITADTTLLLTNRHFKVLAGPGAGKTRFLVNHIKNVLQNSSRLHISRRIACITYTNVAVEQIETRIGGHGGKVEVATIHAFLYKHIVKPYVRLIAAQYDLDVKNLDGHDEIVLSGYQTMQDWKAKIGKTYLKDKDVQKAWADLRWSFDANNTLYLSTRYPINYMGRNDYMVYKRMLWAKGLMHHDDVLFFSYELVTRFPFILTALRAQFPYFLIDEFQDTSPIQVEILKLWVQAETIVGVIGDEAQAIYGFTGCPPDLLSTFSIAGMVDYQIEGNWRSSNEIVTLLTYIRGNSLVQLPQRNVSHGAVHILVGDPLAAYAWWKTKTGTEQIITLSRENITANAMI